MMSGALLTFFIRLNPHAAPKKRREIVRLPIHSSASYPSSPFSYWPLLPHCGHRQLVQCLPPWRLQIGHTQELKCLPPPRLQKGHLQLEEWRPPLPLHTGQIQLEVCRPPNFMPSGPVIEQTYPARYAEVNAGKGDRRQDARWQIRWP